MENAARATADDTEQALDEQAIHNLTETIAQIAGSRSNQPADGNEQGSESAAQQGSTDDRSTNNGTEGATAELTAPTRAEVKA